MNVKAIQFPRFDFYQIFDTCLSRFLKSLLKTLDFDGVVK